MELYQNYIANTDTVIILPEFKIEGAKAQVIEVNRVLYTTDSPLTIMENTLLHHGSNLRGARQSAVFHLGAVHRPPVMISNERGIFFYTSEAITNTENIWFSVAHTKKIQKFDTGTSLVQFTNSVKVTVNVSCNSLKNNYLRGLHLKKLQEEICKERAKEDMTDFYPLPAANMLYVRDGDTLSYSAVENRKDERVKGKS